MADIGDIKRTKKMFTLDELRALCRKNDVYETAKFFAIDRKRAEDHDSPTRHTAKCDCMDALLLEADMTCNEIARAKWVTKAA